jgi:hypothetical protein
LEKYWLLVGVAFWVFVFLASPPGSEVFEAVLLWDGSAVAAPAESRCDLRAMFFRLWIVGVRRTVLILDDVTGGLVVRNSSNTVAVCLVSKMQYGQSDSSELRRDLSPDRQIPYSYVRVIRSAPPEDDDDLINEVAAFPPFTASAATSRDPRAYLLQPRCFPSPFHN